MKGVGFHVCCCGSHLFAQEGKETCRGGGMGRDRREDNYEHPTRASVTTAFQHVCMWLCWLYVCCCGSHLFSQQGKDTCEWGG
jgi:hypothetical protein